VNGGVTRASVRHGSEPSLDVYSRAACRDRNPGTTVVD
jgi:hypothetical protein